MIGTLGWALSVHVGDINTWDEADLNVCESSTLGIRFTLACGRCGRSSGTVPVAGPGVAGGACGFRQLRNNEPDSRRTLTGTIVGRVRKGGQSDSGGGLLRPGSERFSESVVQDESPDWMVWFGLHFGGRRSGKAFLQEKRGMKMVWYRLKYPLSIL